MSSRAQVDQEDLGDPAVPVVRVVRVVPAVRVVRVVLEKQEGGELLSSSSMSWCGPRRGIFLNRNYYN